LCVDLWLKWGLKQSYKPCWELSNNMWQTTCLQRNQGDYWLLMVGSQIDNLIPDPFFGHNLCFKYPNGSCKPILGMYVPKTFQWYKELFNPLNFDLCNHSLKIRESNGTPTPKVGAHLGVWGFIPHTLLHSWEHEMWLSSFILGPHLRKPLPWSQAQG